MGWLSFFSVISARSRRESRKMSGVSPERSWASASFWSPTLTRETDTPSLWSLKLLTIES